MLNASKRALRALIREFLSAHPGSASALNDLIAPLLPFLTSASDCEELLARLARSDSEAAPPGEFRDESDPIVLLHAQKKRDIQRAFTFCLSRHRDIEEDARFSMSTTKAVIGSESLTTHTGTQDSEEGDLIPVPEEPEEPPPDESEAPN
jgi:hypothetical protein